MLFGAPSLSLFIKDALAITEDSKNVTKKHAVFHKLMAGVHNTCYADRHTDSSADLSKLFTQRDFLNSKRMTRITRTGVLPRLLKLRNRLRSVSCSFRRKLSRRAAHLFLSSMGRSFAGTLRRYHPLVLLRHFTYKKLFSYRKKLRIKTSWKRRYLTRVAGRMHIAPMLPSKVFSNTIIHKTTRFRTHMLRYLNYNSNKQSKRTPIFFLNTVRRVGFRNTIRDLHSRTKWFTRSLRDTTFYNRNKARLFARVRRRVKLSRRKRHLSITQLLTVARTSTSLRDNSSYMRLRFYLRKRLIRLKRLYRLRKLLRKLRKNKASLAIRGERHVKRYGSAVLSKRKRVTYTGKQRSVRTRLSTARTRKVKVHSSAALRTINKSLEHLKVSFTSDDLNLMRTLLANLVETRTLRQKARRRNIAGYVGSTSSVKKARSRSRSRSRSAPKRSFMSPRVRRINHKVAKRAEGRGLAMNSPARAVIGSIFNSMRDKYINSLESNTNSTTGDVEQIYIRVNKSISTSGLDGKSDTNKLDPYTQPASFYKSNVIYVTPGIHGNKYAFPPLRIYFNGDIRNTGIQDGRILNGVAQTKHQNKLHTLYPHVTRIRERIMHQRKYDKKRYRRKYRSKRRYWRGIKRSNYLFPISNKSKFVLKTQKRLARKGSLLRARYRYARINMFRTLPSFISMLIRLFYITKSKFDDFIGDDDSNSVDPDLYFDSVLKRFLLF